VLVPDITHVVTIHASPERVYAAVTTAEGIRNWWTREVQLDSRIGGTGEFRFNQGRTVTQVRVDEAELPVRVRWSTIFSNAPGGWSGSTIAFDLRREGGDTVLSFTHRGFREADERFLRVSAGWAYYLTCLQRYLEKGYGALHADIDLARLIRR
jgi:uncharacterized protein YndB with AHSA1/START domain